MCKEKGRSFEVKCKDCGSLNVKVSKESADSDLFGSWCHAYFLCLGCNQSNRVMIRCEKCSSEMTHGEIGVDGELILVECLECDNKGSFS